MKHTGKRLRLILADDHALVLGGIRHLLEANYDVVAVAEDGRSLVEAAERLKPDIILMDISMPQLNGIEAARTLSSSLPDTRLIFVTVHADATFVAEAFKAGASGYVIKRSAPDELIGAIEEVRRGRTYVTPLVTKGFVDSALKGLVGSEPYGRLTPRQREVLQLVAEGQANKEIAEKLFVTPKTVEFHKSRIMRTLGLNTTAELVKYAIKHGIASVD